MFMGWEFLIITGACLFVMGLIKPHMPFGSVGTSMMRFLTLKDLGGTSLPSTNMQF